MGNELGNWSEKNMNLNAIEERELNIGEDVRAAVEMVKQDYGAILTHDSGHTKTGPTWIFTFPHHFNAQIALRMNKAKVTVYLRSTTLSGKDLPDLADGLFVLEKRYPDPDGHPAESLRSDQHAPFLKPSPENPLLLVQPNVGCLKQVLDIYLNLPAVVVDTINASECNGDVGVDSLPRKRRMLSEAQLLAQLDRNAETGKAGELIVVFDELNRLNQCGCPEPAKFVKRIALNDVGCGYDIASTWPGEERCIEVKSTTRAGSDFFITENECQVLAELGEIAWMYRVVVGSDGAGKVVLRLQNPMNVIRAEYRTPVVWRVASEALEAADVE